MLRPFKADRKALVEQLSGFPVFAACSPSALRDLADRGTATSVPANWTLVHDQTPGDACYVVLSGNAHVDKNGQRVAEVGPGDIVGEVALVRHGLRNANIISDTALRVLRIDAEALQRLVPDARQSLLSRAEAHVPPQSS
jgi:CRP-like cAMP-binding protein